VRIQFKGGTRSVWTVLFADAAGVLKSIMHFSLNQYLKQLRLFSFTLYFNVTSSGPVMSKIVQHKIYIRFFMYRK
jgi:hypothetical protein